MARSDNVDGHTSASTSAVTLTGKRWEGERRGEEDPSAAAMTAPHELHRRSLPSSTSDRPSSTATSHHGIDYKACGMASGGIGRRAGCHSPAAPSDSSLTEGDIFNCEVDDLALSSPVCEASVDWYSVKQAQAAITLSLGMARAPYDWKLRKDVEDLLRGGGVASEAALDRFAAALVDRGHDATVRVSTANYAPGTMHFSLRHVFISCKPPSGARDQSHRILDVSFREQFGIASPTSSYSHILEAVPEVFIGTSTTLKAVIDIIASEISKSFNVRRMPTPPWRRVHALYSKWFPSSSKSRVVTNSVLSAPFIQDSGRIAQAV